MGAWAPTPNYFDACNCAALVAEIRSRVPLSRCTFLVPDVSSEPRAGPVAELAEAAAVQGRSIRRLRASCAPSLDRPTCSCSRQPDASARRSSSSSSPSSPLPAPAPRIRRGSRVPCAVLHLRAALVDARGGITCKGSSLRGAARSAAVKGESCARKIELVANRQYALRRSRKMSDDEKPARNCKRVAQPFRRVEIGDRSCQTCIRRPKNVR
jgi:hypothetical protein